MLLAVVLVLVFGSGSGFVSGFDCDVIVTCLGARLGILTLSCSMVELVTAAQELHDTRFVGGAVLEGGFVVGSTKRSSAIAMVQLLKLALILAICPPHQQEREQLHCKQ